MSHPQPPQRQPTPSETQQYAKTVHNVALVALVACPLLALLPPRKLDVYTIGLIGTTAYSGNYLVREHSGRSIWQHVNGSPAPNLPTEAAPATISATEQANLNKELLYAKAEMQKRLSPNQEPTQTTPSVSAQVEQVMQDNAQSLSQREAWKAQRKKEIQDDLDVGKGIGEMITDQIWEVWNWGKTKDDEED